MPGPRFTEAELNDLHLPGFTYPMECAPRELYGELFEGTDWQPVLNLAIITETITDGQFDLRILNAIRRPETNPTHPNVVSTPTQRIMNPDNLRDLLTQAGPYLAIGPPDNNSTRLAYHLEEVNPSRPVAVATYDPHPHPLESYNTDVIAVLTRKLFAEKLGLAAICGEEQTAQLAAKGIYPTMGSVSLSRLVAGFSYVGDREASGEPEFEPIVMVGGVVHCPYPLLIPSETAEYRGVSWPSLTSFPRDVRARNTEGLIWDVSNADVLEVCVRGLCLLTSISAIGQDAQLARHLGLGRTSSGSLTARGAWTMQKNLHSRDEVGRRMYGLASASR